MNRIGTRLNGRSDDGLGVEIAIGSCSATNQHGFFRRHHVLGTGIDIRIDRNRLEAETACGAHDATGYFAAIGDQKFVEHGALSICLRHR